MCSPFSTDLESTTGSWDVYGVQETKRYPEVRPGAPGVTVVAW
jgi:hypothetical protein